jgi:hypothetical protein
MAGSASGQEVFVAWVLFFILVGIAAYGLFYIGRALYERIRLWEFIAQDEELPDPLEILYQYKADEVENQ